MDIPLWRSAQQECGRCAAAATDPVQVQGQIAVERSHVYCVMHVCSVVIHLLGISVAA